MMDRGQERELKSVPGLVLGLAGALATASIAALAAFIAPQSADALPAYAQQTKLACGRCHVSAAGGGALTAFGKAFAANGHKVPSKGTTPGKKGEAPSSAPAAPTPGTASTRTPGTATLFWTTDPGVSNQSKNIPAAGNSN
jgi:hypothetical protein